MVFSSNVFLFIFLPAVLILYYGSPKPLRFVVLTLCSYVFYAWADPRFVLLLIWTTIVDFTCGNLIGGHWRLTRDGQSRAFQRFVLTLSLTNSLGLLAFFKYAMLGQQLLNSSLAMFGKTGTPLLAIVLPAGISFYTFESISYVVDIYRGLSRPASEQFVAAGRSRLLAEIKAFIAFACYLAQFPHLVAGPIIRYQEIEPQLVNPSSGVDRFGRGVFFLSLGLAKKVILANTVGQAADAAFTGGILSFADAWWGVFAYAFQLYFDFSGYSDMAIGLALMLGFQFPRNFDAPYRAVSITDFWRRWHMTLSRWLRDYLYIPLGGNRRGPWRTYVNLILTMLLGGLWHGAGFTFVVWGLYHGIWLAIERGIGRRGIAEFAPRWVSTIVTFLIVCAGWAIFRSLNLSHAMYMISRLTLPLGDVTPVDLKAILYDRQVIGAMLLCGLVAFGGVQTWDLAQRLTPLKTVIAIVLFCGSVIVLAVSSSNPFLYFRF